MNPSPQTTPQSKPNCHDFQGGLSLVFPSHMTATATGTQQVGVTREAHKNMFAVSE